MDGLNPEIKQLQLIFACFKINFAHPDRQLVKLMDIWNPHQIGVWLIMNKK